MIQHQGEAVVLRSWPVHEADQIITLFTREMGKIRGVAKSAARSRRRFGGALEPTTHVRARYVERPKQELVRLDSFEILRSPLSAPVDYGRSAALAFFVETLEETLPDHDPQENIFRLLLAVLDQTRVDCIWMPVTYFALWITRLLGWLPDLSRCARCREPLGGAPAYFDSVSDGLFCGRDEAGDAAKASPFVRRTEMSADSQALGVRIFRTPASALAAEPWPRSRAADLRRFAIESLERHLERRLSTASALARLGGA